MFRSGFTLSVVLLLCVQVTVADQPALTLLLSAAPVASKFPHTLYQTTENPAALPAKLALNFEKYAKGWTRLLYEVLEVPVLALRLHDP
jgi:hypothetical protein